MNGTKRLKPTTMILLFLTICIMSYIVLTKTQLLERFSTSTVLQEEQEIIALTIKENEYVGLNNKQLIKVNKDGIIAYDFEGYEIWSDTLSISNFIVRQREPYLAVGSKNGKSVYLFNTKGRQAEIVRDNPIIYFSVNEKGGLAIIERLGDGHLVSAYDNTGKYIGGLVTYEQKEGYPTTAELSPDNGLLIASYVSTSEPVLTSTLRGIGTKLTLDAEEPGVIFGVTQKGNLVYEIEFVKPDTWISIGDEEMTWYNLQGDSMKTNKLTPVYLPYLNKMSGYGQGFFPVLSTTDITKNIIHRQDTLTYFDSTGNSYFNMTLPNAADYFYSDIHGVIIGSGNNFVGYNKMGNQTFEYHSSVDISKLFYIPESRKGFAVTKEKVMILKPKRG